VDGAPMLQSFIYRNCSYAVCSGTELTRDHYNSRARINRHCW